MKNEVLNILYHLVEFMEINILIEMQTCSRLPYLRHFRLAK